MEAGRVRGSEPRPQVGTGELDRTKSPDGRDGGLGRERLRTLNEELLRVPESFTIHRKLRKPLGRRIEALDEEGGIEFGHAEALAFASLLTEGTHIRLTGQDTERGTFSHRHLAYYDEKTGLQVRADPEPTGALAPFELYNSPLSEIACLGFEYGYSAASPESLILWEAQFGDFANSAQVIIDSFIVSGESKWGQTDTADAAAPPRLRGRRAGALERPDRALPPARRRGQHPARQPDAPPRSTSICCAARRGSPSRGRWWSSRRRGCCGCPAPPRRSRT